MPEINYTLYDGPWAGGGGQAAYAQLNASPITAIGPTDHVECTGYAGRIYVVTVNGATNSVIYGVQGSWDGSTWFNLATRADSSATYANTGVTTTGGSTAVLFLNPQDVPRYLRVNVTTANANGSTHHVWMER